MPIGRSAKKSLRKSVKNSRVNKNFKNKLKEIIKKFLDKPDKKNFDEVQAWLDKALKKNIFKANKVSRLKARYSKKVASKKVVKTAKKM